MKAVVAAFNQEKALVGAFSVIMNLRMQLFEALISTQVAASSMFLALRALTSHSIHFFLDNKELFTNHDPTHNSEAGKVMLVCQSAATECCGR